MKLILDQNNTLHQAGLEIVRLLKKNGHRAYWVGGVVRDLVLGRSSDNLDIATDALPDEVQRLLRLGRMTPKEIGKQFGTILVICNSHKIEITTFRSEGYYSDKRHPDSVEFISNYERDALRRDLTINAMYLDPEGGHLLDPAKGLADIQRKLVRFVGNAKKRIDEDYLRMLRAVRFAVQLGFKLEKNTYAAIKTRAKLIQEVSGERIKSELDKILISENRASGFKLLEETGLLKFIFPEIAKLRRFSHQSKTYHLEGDLLDHTLLALKQLDTEDVDLGYAVLFHDSGKPMRAVRKKKPEGWVISTPGHEKTSVDIFRRYAKSLHFSKASRQKIEWAILNHSLRSPFIRDMKTRKKIELALHSFFPFLIELWKVDATANMKKNEKGELIFGEPKAWFEAKNMLRVIQSKQNLLSQIANGKFIMSHVEINPGPALGRLISSLKIKIISGEIKNISDAKIFLQNFEKRS
jgi:tRNA nucleotidyltransferase/poly(A) polymerase